MQTPNSREIPQHPVESWMPDETRRIRTNAPRYLVSLIEEGVLENVSSVEDIQPLEGGQVSALYLLKNNDNFTVVKFRQQGASAEAEALQAWETQEAHVPGVKAFGVVPATKDETQPTSYIILEGIVDSDGHPAVVGSERLLKQPDNAPGIGKLMGEELSKMHRATTVKPFGEFADIGDSQAPTWKEYLTSIVGTEREYLLSIGVTEERMSRFVDKLDTVDFRRLGVYVHGDYGAANVLVESEEPLKIRVFDPNPKIGDPYFDIARILNASEDRKILHEDQRGDQQAKLLYERMNDCHTALLEAYKQSTGQELNELRLLANRAVELIPKVEFRDRRVSAQMQTSDASSKVVIERQVNLYRGMLKKTY